MLTGRVDRPLLILVVLILFGMGFSSYWQWIQIRDTLAQGLHDRELLASTDELISQMKDAETGQRGYLLTGSEEYLAPYTKALAAIPALLDRVTDASGVQPPLPGEAKLMR